MRALAQQLTFRTSALSRTSIIGHPALRVHQTRILLENVEINPGYQCLGCLVPAGSLIPAVDIPMAFQMGLSDPLFRRMPVAPSYWFPSKAVKRATIILRKKSPYHPPDENNQ